MQKFLITELSPHPKNDYFFDDVVGEKWREFLESIKTSGVIEPIVITQNKVIVSGHQRVRACKELGISDILAEMRFYDTEEKVIKDLIETNIRQRGSIGGSATKMGHIITELEKIYGIQQGAGRPEIIRNIVPNYSDPRTQQELADKLGINLKTLKNAKALTNLPEEIQQLVEDGNISPSTASRLIAKLSTEEQEQLVAALPATEKLTQKQVQTYIDQIARQNVILSNYKTEAEKALELKKRISELEAELKKAETQVKNNPRLAQEIEGYKRQIAQLTREKANLESQKVQTVTQKVEVDRPETLAEVQRLREELDRSRQSFNRMYNENVDSAKKLSYFMGENTEWNLVAHCSEINGKMMSFIQEMVKYDYMAEVFNKIPVASRLEYKRSIEMIQQWAQRILDNIQVEENVVDVITEG